MLILDLTEQMILERLVASINRLTDTFESKNKIKEDIAEIFEDKYQQSVILKSLISLLATKEIINEQELEKYVKELRERIKES